jgi:hypothetical protein
MLIPRFSIRWLLGLTTISAGVSLVLSYAVRGQAWAIGVTAGLWSLVIVALSYIGAFLVAWLIAQSAAAGRRGWQQGTGESPFAALPAGEYPAGSAATGALQPAADTPPPMTG